MEVKMLYKRIRQIHLLMNHKYLKFHRNNHKVTIQAIR